MDSLESFNNFPLLGCRSELGQFTCASGQCIEEETSLCNNRDDCDDGSDETEELCSKYTLVC